MQDAGATRIRQDVKKVSCRRTRPKRRNYHLPRTRRRPTISTRDTRRSIVGRVLVDAPPPDPDLDVSASPLSLLE